LGALVGGTEVQKKRFQKIRRKGIMGGTKVEQGEKMTSILLEP